MKLSKHNIISSIAGSKDYFIINLLSGEADILTTRQYNQLIGDTYPDKEELIKKGYLIDPGQEEKLYRKKYLEFLDRRDSDEVQLFFVPAYSCNFNCAYCYQGEYLKKTKKPDLKIIKSFFGYIDRQFADRKKYLTVFGGEPLLDSAWHRDFIRAFIRESNERKLDIAIVTNGYHLSSYIDIVKEASVREIQVTLDGTEEMHNKRRPLKSGGGTFRQVVEGIDACLENDLPVNLRMVLDKQNIDELPKLARFAAEKLWTKSPLFKTQLGRNYELHNCQVNSDQLYNRIDLYRDIYQLIKKHPEIADFHKPAFSISRFLFEEGILPDPLFDSCPGTKTEWAFDYSGKIYSCTATVGKAGEELGTFYPEVFLNEDRITEWESRDILEIPECRDCSLQLACGGGCGSVAKNQTGRLHAPDCRPVKQLLELGMAAYFR